MVRHPNWEFAEELLAQVAPGSSAFDADQISGLTRSDWTEFQIDDRDPATVTEELMEYCAPIVSGMLVVVTFQSFRIDVGPFFVNTERLLDFSSTYSEIYDDAFVAGDLFILSLETGTLVIVHHNGLVATVHGRARQPS